MKSIEVIIGESGEVKIEAIGFKGAACEMATKALETALGVTVDTKKKPERYQEDQQQVHTGN